jgi:hypothetical protein
VSIGCPRCSATPTIVVFRYYDTASLFCRVCECAWATDASAHPELRTIEPATPRRAE